MGPAHTGHGPVVYTRREVNRILAEIEAYEQVALKEAILEGGRIDLLVKHVFGWDVNWHHLEMMQHQARHNYSMCLAPRGSGKTMIRVLAKSIMDIICDPEIRIILASYKAGHGIDSLSAIKRQMEQNERFIALFGNLVGDKWANNEIVVKTRKGIHRDPTISVVSVEGAVASKHCNIIHADDLFTEEGSSTALQRQKTETFLWKTLMPTLIGRSDEHELHFTNTRYHPYDLGWSLGAPDYLGAPPDRDRESEPLLTPEQVLIVPAIMEDEDGEEHSYWAEYHPLKDLKRRRSANRLSFETQYQQNIVPMKTERAVDNIIEFDRKDMPPNLPVYMGVDLSVGETDKSDEFYLVLTAYDKESKIYYTFHRVHGRYSFTQQRDLIVQAAKEYKIRRGLIETVAYQKALFNEIMAEHPDLPIFPYKPTVDKLTRFQQRSGLFENSQVHIERGLGDVMKQMMEFTGQKGRKDDAVDAWELSVRAVEHRVKKAPIEFGILRPTKGRNIALPIGPRSGGGWLAGR